MSAAEVALAIGYALAGSLVAGLLSMIPALHIYNIAGLVVAYALARDSAAGDAWAFVFVGMTAGYALVSSIPSIFLAAPDAASAFMVTPGQKFVRQGRGHEAAVLTAVGGMGGILVLTILAMAAPPLLRAIRDLLQPHLHWILWAIIAWMLLSEWPKGADREPSGGRRWLAGWRSLFAGLAAFGLSGLLGLILFYRNPVPIGAAVQGLLPAFVGLFAVPGVVLNITSRVEMPPQHQVSTVDASPGVLARGIVTGTMGGLFAAFFPAVTGGIGGMIAGHATAQRDDRVFLVSQGASKSVYYVGALLLLFVPRLHLTRGGMASMLDSLWSGYAEHTYYTALAAALAAGIFAFAFMVSLAGQTARLVGKLRYRLISAVTLALLVAVVLISTGWKGLIVCSTAAGIGSIPVLWGSRRTNCMGVILLPLAIQLSGGGGDVARWLGLL